ncbi:hypothetical protein [Flavobacterium sp. RS13.1]|uniref:hypothetical protein n=1 Tax=Flavobacterium sp. RS13.1 TaxID=3400345 RepID=UPI003AAB4A6E
MATTIAILKDGTPVRIHLFDNPIFDVDGFLVRFTTLEINPQVYRYHQHAEFKREDRKKPDLSGYYNEDLFLKYVQKVEPIPTLDILTKYNFDKILATEEEEITVSTIDFNEPYDYFYNEKKYTFKLQRTLDNKGVRNYLKPIIENFKTVDIKINTDGVNGVTVINDQSTTSGGYFYKKNLGDFINTSTITNIQKSNFKKIMTLIVFKIREINRDIIPIIATNTHLFDKESGVADGDIDYSDPTHGFTDLEKLLFDLKRGWGYYYSTPPSIIPRPFRDSFDAQFSSLSTYEDYLNYYSSLQNFYTKCYSTKNLKHYPSDKKLQYLLEILTPSGLSLLPYNLILETIKSYLVGKLSEESQRHLVRLIISITPAHANDFLDFLLEKQNGDQTNFETIYETLTDGRLERYTFVNWFVDEQTNKKYFAFAIFELWKVSKYNLAYIAPGITPTYTFTNFSGVDPTNYFVINPTEYNNNNFLEFSSKDIGIHKIDVSFESSIEGKKIKIDKLIRDEHEVDIRKTHDDKTVFFGAFHLYQQISFSGFEANLDLSIPKKATVPAFLFHFIEEFDRIADFDAAASLVIDLTTDVLLTYFLGGANFIADLNYLKYTTKIGRALIGSLEPTEAVVVWRGFETGSEAFTLTASSLTHINTYLISTENNLAKKQILEGYRKVLIPLIFLGAGASLTARAHATREAERVLDLVNALPSGVPHGLSLDMINLLNTLKGSKTVSLTTFGNRLNTLDLGGVTNTIFSKYNTVFTDAQKLKFFNDFQHIEDLAFWRLLNNGRNASGIRDGRYIDNWISLSERGLSEAKFTEYICVQRRTDALIRYVDDPITKPVISTLSYERKLVFIDTFGDVDDVTFAKFVDKPQLITYWKRYYDDVILRGDFLGLGQGGMIKIIEELGDISNDLFLGFKRNPSKLSEYINLNDSGRAFLKKNKHFWLVNGYKYEYIDSFKLEIIKAVNEYKNNVLFTNPLKKVEALDELRISSKFTKGDFVEKPMKIYLNNLISNDEDVMYSVDILFKKANGTNFKPSIYLDIDAMVVNTSINKIKTPYSAKLNIGDTFKSAGTKAYDDAQKLEFFRNLPEDISQAKSYIINQNKKVWKDVSRPQDLNQIFSIEVKYIDKSGQSQTMPLSNFKQKLKSTPYLRNDFIEINPSTFGTTREKLMESTYNRIITD